MGEHWYSGAVIEEQMLSDIRLTAVRDADPVDFMVPLGADRRTAERPMVVVSLSRGVIPRRLGSRFTASDKINVSDFWCHSRLSVPGGRLPGVIEPNPKTDLLRYLQEARDALVWKLDGLSEYDIRRPLPPTGTNLGAGQACRQRGTGVLTGCQ